jgi:hypothetical protein
MRTDRHMVTLSQGGVASKANRSIFSASWKVVALPREDQFLAASE